MCHCVYLHFSLTDYGKSRLEWKMESQIGKLGEHDSRTRLRIGKLPTPFVFGRVKCSRERACNLAYNLNYLKLVVICVASLYQTFLRYIRRNVQEKEKESECRERSILARFLRRCILRCKLNAFFCQVSKDTIKSIFD